MSLINRAAEIFLKEWYCRQRRKPLILRGARQVGKSTLVKKFAKQEGLILCEVNLERNLFLDKVFESLDPLLILRELEGVTGQVIRADNSILFLDEIQATPHAIQALRYFWEELPELPIIAAGSLLEFTLSDHSFSMPVGRVEYHHIFPVSFSEYLSTLEPNLFENFLSIKIDDFPVSVHRKLLQRQREYFFVGGMPEAVATFKESGSLTDVSTVHRSIVDTYQDDFSKYSSQKELLLLQKVFNYIPRSLGLKTKYSNISREQRAAKVKNAIELLAKARCCYPIYHSHCSGVPLHADIVESVYKLIFMDIGLANHICGIDWLTINSYDNQQLINEGGLAEQFVGQHLINIGAGRATPKLHYWLRERKSANAEIDYVISLGKYIVPIEVKSGKSGSLKSLQQFIYRKRGSFAIRFDQNLPSVQEVEHDICLPNGNKSVKYTLLSLPLYAVEQLPRFLEHFRSEWDG